MWADAMKNEIYEYQSLFSMSPRIVWSLSWLCKHPCPSKPLVVAICWYPIIVCIMYDVLQVHAFFISNAFFSTQPQCYLTIFMNWVSNVAQVLLNTYGHYHSETRVLFTTFLSMSRIMSIYVVSVFLTESLPSKLKPTSKNLKC